jgi:hypothetical protein
MDEKSFTGIIGKSLSQIGFFYKIPDPRQVFTESSRQNPYDYISANPYMISFVECKLLKGYQSFNFGHIREHQIYNLMLIKNAIDNLKISDKVFSLICLGIWESRKYFDVMFFDISYIYNLMQMGKKSLLKKELLDIKESGYYKTIKKGLIENIENIKNVVIF